MRARVIALAFAAATAAGAPACTSAWAVVRVMASTADLAALATAIAGEPAEGDLAGVSVDAIVPAGVDAEAFEPRPGDIEKLRHADVIVRVGLGYDYWLDRLLVQAGNARLMRGGDGYVDGSAGIPLLEVRGESVVNESGHSHGAANPHYWLDPQNAVIITGGIAEALIRVLPGARERIVAGRARFLAALDARIAVWSAQAAPFAGAKLIAYHNSWPYFARRFRLDLVDFIEPKPGVAASPAHLAHLIAEGRQAGVRAVLHEPYEPAETSRFVAARLGVPVVVLAPSVGTMPGTGDYLGLFDANLAALGKALGAAHP
jgi:ABC-type Zn uptake system ZnuABC Zn-binding protein ZnuA